MNKELEDKLAENAVELLAFVEKSSSFVVEQAPLYVQELIQFHFWTNVLTIAYSLAGLIVLAIAVFINYKAYVKNTNPLKDFFDFMPCIALGAIIIVPIIIETPKAFKECIKAKYAPRVLIIEKLRGN